VYNRAVGRFSATRGGSADLAALLAGAAARAVQEPQGPGLAAAPVPRSDRRHAGHQQEVIRLATPIRAMSRRRFLLAPLVLALAGCGPTRPGTGGDPKQATCTPGGRDLRVTARNLRFDIDCLAAPAGRPAGQHHHRQPGRRHPHNPAIDTDPPSTRALFTGSLVDGVATVTDRVPALPAGTYSFRRDMHPSTMSGTLVLA
jgi:hypothetical protein